MATLRVDSTERLYALLGNSEMNSVHNSLRKDPRTMGRVQLLFFYSGKESPSNQYLVAFFLIEMFGVFFGFSHFGVKGFLSALLPALFVFIYLERAAMQRVDSFERDYTAFLLSLSSSIRTGLDPVVAFKECGKLFSSHSELAKEVKKTADSIESGLVEEHAFAEFAYSIRHPDIGLLRSALILSRRQGSSLGNCLHRLARVTRQRQSFRRKIRGAIAMQRLSAFGIAGCTVVIALIQFTSNPKALIDAWNHPVGKFAVGGGISLVLVGLLSMLYMSRRRM